MHAFLSNLANRQTDKHRGHSHLPPPLSRVNYNTQHVQPTDATAERSAEAAESSASNLLNLASLATYLQNEIW